MIYEGKICRPAFEKGSFKLPISVGCSYNACKFCCLFKYLTFKTIDDELIFKEIDKVKLANGKPTICFLGDGNALHNDTNRLINIISYLKQNIPTIKSIRMDGTVSDIKEKTDEDLKRLSELGVDIIYIGIECAIDEVLQFMNKEHKSVKEALIEIDRLKKYNINYSAHIMSGVCGKGRGIENAKLLADFFNLTKPINITDFTMGTSRKQKLYEDIIKGSFVISNEIENLYETRELINDINIETAIDSFHDHIPFRLKGHLPTDKNKLIKQIDDEINFLKINSNVNMYYATESIDNVEILNKMGYKINVVNQFGFKDLTDLEYKEELVNDLSKEILVQSIKEYKKNHIINNNDIFVSSAKVVIFDNKILGKPKDRLEAYSILKMLSNQKHNVSSSISVYHNGEVFTKNDNCELYFRNLSDEEIYRYIDNIKPFSEYGAYNVKDKYFDFEDTFIGDFNTVIGFPLKKFLEILKMWQ